MQSPFIPPSSEKDLEKFPFSDPNLPQNRIVSQIQLYSKVFYERKLSQDKLINESSTAIASSIKNVNL